MMNETRPRCTGKEETTLPVSPHETWDNGRDDIGHAHEKPDVVIMLPLDDGILVQVAHVSNSGLATRLKEHPTNVGVEETFVGGVGIKVGVGVPMMSTMTARPPFDGTLDSTGAGESEEVFKGF